MSGLVKLRPAADDLSISVKTLKRLIETGRIDAIDVSVGSKRQQLRIAESDLAAFKDRRRKSGGEIRCRSVSAEASSGVSSKLAASGTESLATQMIAAKQMRMSAAARRKKS